MFSQEVPCRSSANNASCFRFASAVGIHSEYSDVLFSLLTLFTMCCLWIATTLPFACQRMRALLSSFANCRQGVWKSNGSGFCFSESTSSMPARNWQCRGQSFLLLVLSKDNVLPQSSLYSNGCRTDLVIKMTFDVYLMYIYCTCEGTCQNNEPAQTRGGVANTSLHAHTR